MDFDLILEIERRFEIAFGMNARPGEGRVHLAHDNGESKRAEKSVLGRFHETKKIRVVHDPGHIRVREFHPARCFEFVSHKPMVIPAAPIYEAKFRAVSRHSRANSSAI